MADIRINSDIIFNFHILASKIIFYPVFVSLSSLFRPTVAYAQPILETDLFWDPIVSIEPVGLEHVYDIEVEGTHNFIGNGIFAHNTYIQKTEGEREEDTADARSPAQKQVQGNREELYIPQELPNPIADEYSVGTEFIKQFGAKDAVWDIAIRDEDKVGITHEREDNKPPRCGIGSRAVEYSREVRVRIAAHEV